MIYRGLYHFSIAAHKGLANNPIQYFADDKNRDLGIVKRQRNPNIKLIIAPFPLQQGASEAFFFHPQPKSLLTTGLQA